MYGPKPWFWPDTQGFLAVAIITIVSAILLIFLLHPISISDTVQGVVMTIVGVLVGALKDVIAYYFNSSSGSRTKDETINAMASTAAERPAVDPLAKWAAPR